MKDAARHHRTVLILVPIVVAVAAIGVFAWRRSNETVVACPSRISSLPPSSEQIAQKRLELISELLRALEPSAGKNDRPKVAELSDGLVRESDATVAPAVEELKRSRVWNYRIALLDVLCRIRTSD